MYKKDRENFKNDQKGITLIALVITIIILLIISGIGIYAGTNSIKKVELEELKTNMLLIEAKAREYVEEANFKIGKETDEKEKDKIKEEVYEINGNLPKAVDEGVKEVDPSIPINECYVVTEGVLKSWGLNKIKLDTDEKYLLKFDEENITVQIYNTKGYDGKYSLTDLEK